MNIITFLIVGLIAGWLAGKIVTGQGLGVTVNMIVGVIGAFIGGLLSRYMIGEDYGLFGSIILSTLGAVILLLIVRLIGGNRVTHNGPPSILR
jgi:uncharacterized membrane protein YeaQ/YmgE (transglycosylase-associated protein family)